MYLAGLLYIEVRQSRYVFEYLPVELLAGVKLTCRPSNNATSMASMALES